MNQTMPDTFAAAQRCAVVGLSVIPIRTDGSKAPSIDWAVFQGRTASADELQAWFEGDTPRGLGIVCGRVSGGLEVMDFDDPAAYREWESLCADHDLGDLVERLPIVVTPSGGRHLYYRCENAAGNMKLARKADKHVRIETRGEGGMVVAPGSPNACHPTKRPYKWYWLGPEDIPLITAGERSALHSMARVLDAYAEPEKIAQAPPQPRGSRSGLRPGDEYNDRGDYEGLLERHGWTRAGHRGSLDLWRRPGKTRGISATGNYAESRLFYVFSSNAAPFEDGKSYTPMAVYTTLEHAGDYAEAARALAAEGYGEQPAQTVKIKVGKKRRASEPEREPEDKEIVEVGHHLLTDTANARRFIGQHQEDVRFDHSLKEWFIWDGTRWGLDEKGHIQELAKLTARSIYVEAAQCHDDGFRVELAKHAKSSLNITRILAMIKLATTVASVSMVNADWDRDPWLFNTPNGTVNLRTGQMHKHDRGDYITQMAGVAYNPAVDCPAWKRCMETWLPNADTRNFVQRAVGLTLTGVTNQEALFYKYGTGQNGKSKFTETIKRILGNYGFKSQRETFMVASQERNAGAASPQLMSLIGKRFVSVAEVQQGDKLNEALIKDLTGEDTVNARALYRAEINFVPQCKLWFYGNHKPVIKGDDKGIWRRFLLIPFTVQIAEKDKDVHLLDKLIVELPGILNWAIEGCLLWQREGLKPPPEVLAATEAFRSEQDVIGNFIKDCCYVGPKATVAAGYLYRGYENWAKDNGEYTKSQRFFGMTLTQRGFEQYRTGASRNWRGIGLLTPLEIEYRDSLAGDGCDPCVSDLPKLSIVNPHMEKFAGNADTRVTSVTPELPFDSTDPNDGWEVLK